MAAGDESDMHGRPAENAQSPLPPPELGRIVELQRLGDERGRLIALEDHATGFSFRRAYFIYGTRPGVSRGFHAHRTLRQLVISLVGSCRFDLDDGKRRTSVILDRPTKGLFIEPMIWHEMHDFSPDCTLAVLASENYDEADYIRDYREFLKLVE
jgi:dTDP-4-dehydrorhamnose 3,5-epimerase-like enzyme